MKLLKLSLLLFLAAGPSQAQMLRTDAHAAREAYVERVEREMTSLGISRVAAVVLRELISQSWDGSAWVSQSRTIFDYESGRLEVSLSETWDGDSWEPSWRTVNEYSGNLLVSTLFEEWIGGAWIPEDRTTSTYSNGTLTESVSQSFDGSQWVNVDRTTYTISGGVITAGTSESWSGTAWELDERFTMMEEDGDVIYESEDWIGSAWVNSTRTVYTDITIEDLLEEFENFAEESGMVGFGVLLRLPNALEQEWDGTQWVNVSRQISERDSEGRPTIVSPQEWTGTEWSGESRYRATYDSQGRLTLVEFQSSEDGTTWTTSLSETYEYDSSGLLASMTQAFDIPPLGLQNLARYLFDWIETSTAVGNDEMPGQFALGAIYPNPFNPAATITYSLDVPGHATVRVFDALGRLVDTLADHIHAAGEYELVFDAAAQPSGIYLIRLETSLGSQTRMVTLLR